MNEEARNSFSEIQLLRRVVEEEAAATERAVLAPREVGGLTRGERAAFAERIARLGNNFTLVDLYHETLLETDAGPELHTIALGGKSADPRLAALVEYVDLLTVQPTLADAGHIKSLRAAGISEADIVRLSELISFINYRLRTDIGLALLESAT